MAVNQDHATLPKTPFSRTAVAVAAETAFHLPTTTVTLLDRADNTDGARITKLYAIPRANIATANNVQIYTYDGTTKTLIDSALMATVNPGASVANAKTDFGVSLTAPMELKAGLGLEIA